jgi:predicted transcriptional regulator
MTKKPIPTQSRNNLMPSQLRAEYNIASRREQRLDKLTRGSKFGAANQGRHLTKEEIEAWKKTQK